MLSPAVQALIISARKHSLLDENNLRRIGSRAERRGVQGLADVRGWLAAGTDCTPRLAQVLTTMLPPSDDIRVGGNLLLAHLADGGMGTVYVAQAPDERLVVVKTLRSEFSDNLRYAHRFKREVAITAKLEHPNLVRCLGHGEHANGQLYLVLEYVTGGDLAMLINNGHRLSETEALLVCHHVAKGVACAHASKLIHRDIKPGNIFLAADGTAKLADFGLARSTTEVYSLNTIEGRAIGSPSFMAPEQTLGRKDLDTRADLYAIGCLLYYMLVGAAPFTGPAPEILKAHQEGKVPDVRAKRPEVSERTAKTILKLMMKDPAKRYQEPTRLVESLNKTMRLLGADPERQVPQETINLSLPHAREAQALFGSEAPLQPTAIIKRTKIHTSEIVRRTTPWPLPTSARPTLPELRLESDVPPSFKPVAELAAMPSYSDGPTQPADQTPFKASPILSPPSKPSPTRPSKPMPSPQVATFTQSAISGAELSMADAGMQTVRSDGAGAGARVLGDFRTAFAGDWLTLEPQHDPQVRLVLLARPSATLGKLREVPVDLTLRVYPLDMYVQESQRISKEHCRLRADREKKALLLEDLGSANGTMLDGRVLNPLQPWQLEENRTHQVEIPASLRLSVTVRPQRSQQVFLLENAPAGGDGVLVGIDTTNVNDAVVIRRLDNRQGLIYALVLRRITVGGEHADVSLRDWHGPDLELALYAGHWLWRVLSTSPWHPLGLGVALGLSGLIPRAGGYDDFK